MYYLFFRKLIYKQHGISLFAHLWIFELSRLFSLRYHVRIWGLFFVPLFFFKKNSLYLVITSLICSAVIYLNIFFMNLISVVILEYLWWSSLSFGLPGFYYPICSQMKIFATFVSNTQIEYSSTKRIKCFKQKFKTWF